ncbi:MAG: glycoside hydrolase family 2 TIM barrel-domain containing protein [Candidatus Eiseniibacteriota bacterium]
MILKFYVRAAALVLPLFFATAPALAAEVTVLGTQIQVDGKPFVPRGAAGREQLAVLKGLGANTVRSYGGDPGKLLDEAERVGLKVIVGLWLEHPRRGFDYRNRAAVDAQLAEVRKIVERYRNHPALLAWGIGNEVEAELEDASLVWPAIEQAAHLVKSLDPHHPTMAVLQEVGADKVRKIKTAAPSIDIVGVNSYGDAVPTVPARVRAQGWTGPIIVSEFGAVGQWQAGQTQWGALVEPSSTEKADRLRQYLAVLGRAGVGQILFLWGHKQEVTPTWHSLLLPSGEWQESAEVMAAAWGGTTPGADRAPRVTVLRMEPGPVFRQGIPAHATLDADDPDGDSIAVEWHLLEESTDLKQAGDAEAVPPAHDEALRAADNHGVWIKELRPGNYRLFATLRDGRGGAATANVPFQVR